MTSVVIAAHNEGAVIGATLDALLAGAAPDELDVVVVANGCTDDTAAVARERQGVRVVELAEAGKAKALNAGDAAAKSFPRIYLDADIRAEVRTIRALVAALDADSKVLAAVPRRVVELSGRPTLVKAYFAINTRIPVFTHGLFGRGLIAVSETGRRRFRDFPDLVADDLFLDSQFSPAEKLQVEAVSAVVAAPLRTADLIHRLVRVRRGNATMRAAGDSGAVEAVVRPADRSSWLRDVVIPRPWLAPAGVAYAGITGIAAVRARRSPEGQNGWERDESTRGESLDVGVPESGRRVLNLCFHGIGQPGRALEPGEGRYWITVETFEQILDEVALWPHVRLSFDDGNKSDIEHGLPGLASRGLVADFFPLAGRLDKPGSLSSEDVRDLHHAGMTIGTHGMDHRPWRGLDAATQHKELIEARVALSDLIGTEVSSAALPLGRYDRQLLSSLKTLAYRTVYTSDRRPARAGTWLQPRYSVTSEDTVESLRREVLIGPSRLVLAKSLTKSTMKRWR